MPEVDQLNAGLAIRGERYRVEIQPRACRLAHEEFDGTMYISVAARSSSWGDDWARATGDAGILARRQDVRLTLTAGGLDELQVLPAKYADLPEFRPGFTLTLEPGMREPILVALQRVECVAQLTTAVCTVIEPLLGRTRELDALTVLQPHEVDAIKAIAAGIVLGKNVSTLRSGDPCSCRRSTRRGHLPRRATNRTTRSWALRYASRQCKRSWPNAAGIFLRDGRARVAHSSKVNTV